MAAARALVVHAAGSSRAQVRELLTQEGYRVEAVSSSYRCIASFIDDPAELVVLGLGSMAEGELEIIRTLKREAQPPRLLVTFPGSRRELAVSALEAGADGYVLEPFYVTELKGAVRGQMTPRAAPAASAGEELGRFAREVAHAINNPLQIVSLLLAKDRVTKRELESGIPPHLQRIEAVVSRLKEFGDIGASRPEPSDPMPLAREAAEASGVAFQAAGSVRRAEIDPRHYRAALQALFGALTAWVGEAVQLTATMEGAVVSVAVPLAAFGSTDPRNLPEEIFVVSEDRDVMPGLALARVLLGGELTVAVEAEAAVFGARV